VVVPKQCVAMVHCGSWHLVTRHSRSIIVAMVSTGLLHHLSNACLVPLRKYWSYPAANPRASTRKVARHELLAGPGLSE
jgi:hypothetical protein